MKLINDGRWTPRVNFQNVLCDCGKTFETSVARRIVRCPSCLAAEDIFKLREEAAIQWAQNYGKEKA